MSGRLSISRATSLPPLQFRPLMPLAFRNVAAATAGTEDTVASPLGQVSTGYGREHLSESGA